MTNFSWKGIILQNIFAFPSIMQLLCVLLKRYIYWSPSHADLWNGQENVLISKQSQTLYCVCLNCILVELPPSSWVMKTDKRTLKSRQDFKTHLETRLIEFTRSIKNCVFQDRQPLTIPTTTTTTPSTTTTLTDHTTPVTKTTLIWMLKWR